MRFPFAALALVVMAGCPSPQGDGDRDDDDDDGGEGEGEGEGEAGEGEGEGEGEIVDGLQLLQRLAGLWSGPATSQTSLGDFPIMSMDLQDTQGTTLFARGDLDELNSIRFGFSIETHIAENGVNEDVLVFRNGGLFLGLARDSRAKLIAHDDALGTYRFCDVERDCEYVDATWTVVADSLVLEATVLGEPHMRWEADREETRPLPAVYPVGLEPQPADADFPPMAQLTATVSFAELAQAADVWVLLTSTPCGLTFNCTPSRSKRVPVAAGASSVDVVIEQLHAGEYQANVILDRDRNMAETLTPTSGDGAGQLDADVVVSGTDAAAATLPIVFTVP